MKRRFVIPTKYRELQEFLSALPPDELWIGDFEPYHPWNYKKNDALNAMLRDIARWRINCYDVPNQVFERCVDDFKRSEIWPKESDPEPDYMTGEVLYRPKSRRKLSPKEQDGIINWLGFYMREHAIPSNDPRYAEANQG